MRFATLVRQDRSALTPALPSPACPSRSAHARPQRPPPPLLCPPRHAVLPGCCLHWMRLAGRPRARPRRDPGRFVARPAPLTSFSLLLGPRSMLSFLRCSPPLPAFSAFPAAGLYFAVGVRWGSLCLDFWSPVWAWSEGGGRTLNLEVGGLSKMELVESTSTSCRCDIRL